ncbi:TOMM precursor leader peptide-binding protein [Streptomyces sp. NPDC047028]|uniref:TOMM precursor leader peptide-binding protein n=1 Tax=Streptomyces sp. NPDC047028 TaxID=3155793 RepID=UPI00340D6D10
MTEQQETMWHIVGEGMLRAALDDTVTTTVHGSQTLLVSAYDTVDDERDDALAALAASRGEHWLPMRATTTEVLVGPLVSPGVPGCHRCVRSRGERLSPEARAAPEVPLRSETSTARLLPTLVHVASSIAAEETRRFCMGQLPLTQLGLLVVARHTHLPQLHRFIPEAGCVCDPLYDDDRTAGLLVLDRARKPRPSTFREHDIGPQLPYLKGNFIGNRTGVIGRLAQVEDTALPTFEAAVGLAGRRPEIAVGRGTNAEAAAATAVAEALERLGGWRPRGRRTVVRGSFQDLAGDALDPILLGLHSPEQYLEDGFGHQPYSPDTELPWVWGYSCRAGRPVLVPESVAYYGSATMRDLPIVQETSSGCAVGSSLAEAVFHGLLEILERDALLLTWYSRAATSRVSLASAPDRRIPLLADRVTAFTGYDIEVFAMTLNHGVPAFLALASDLTRRADRPARICSGSAGPDPHTAVASVLHEVATMAAVLPHRYAGQQADALAMVHNSALVREMPDHLVLYGQPAASDRFDFLNDGRVLEFSDLVEHAQWPHHTDLCDDVRELIRRCLADGLDVIIVDQTNAEHRRANLRCVKTLVPGALPLTFGYRFRRTHGLPRLQRAHRILGQTDRALKEINPHPHPFP